LELNQKYVVKAVLEASPPDPDARKALKRELADPQKLEAYLQKNPGLLQTMLRGAEGDTIVHELTHDWQARRDRPVDVAAIRNQEPIDWEIEAFREEMRYFHEKLMRDPAVADREPEEMQAYTTLLTGYDNFVNYVKFRCYSAGDGGGSLVDIQKALARRSGASAQKADVAATLDQYDLREKTFLKEDLPTIQKQGAALLVERDEKAGRPYAALALAGCQTGFDRAATDRLESETIAYLKKSGSLPLAERRDAWGDYEMYLGTKKAPIPNELGKIYYQFLVEHNKDVAAHARNPRERDEALRAADSWARDLKKWQSQDTP